MVLENLSPLGEFLLEGYKEYPSHPLPEGVEVLASSWKCQYCESPEEVKFLFRGKGIAKAMPDHTCHKYGHHLTEEGCKLLRQEMAYTERQLALGIL